MRQVVGLRNSGHTVAKLLAGCSGAPTLRVVNYTHPEYGDAAGRVPRPTPAPTPLLMRGTEGEPVADARRLQRLDVYVGGVARAELSLPAQEGVLTEPPVLPRSNDAATTARCIQAIVSGAMPAPAPIDGAGRVPAARPRRAAHRARRSAPAAASRGAIIRSRRRADRRAAGGAAT